ncbi:MAG: SUMF1/EgtB/PvdO family nonheme iron enzyme [Sedimentisphaerales bacterium]
MDKKFFMNSIGMKLVLVESGDFVMGQEQDGDFDEKPAHRVQITRPFWMSAAVVTNEQYEKFDRSHRKFRGRKGFSKNDSEAVVFVSWYDAMNFCKWLSAREGKTYRLPTEAEWEYACRAGTSTAYNTGKTLPDEYHRNQKFSWKLRRASLATGKTTPNDWGLYDMHGLVEEWCYDWYGPYEKGIRKDPVGRVAGSFKVTRGGSHSTDVSFLRSANRLGTIPQDKHWLIGFRVVQGEMPKTKPLPAPPPQLCMSGVSQKKYNWSTDKKTSAPLFAPPICYIKGHAKGFGRPFYKYHHCPAITWCPNGDLLAAWFNTNSEIGREMTIVASRLRAGCKEWEPASEFFKTPDRNMTGTSLFHDGRGTLYHTNGLSEGDGWANLAWTLRKSTDNGRTWSEPIFGNSEHQLHNQIIAGMFMTREGYLVQPCDATWGEGGGSVIHISRDEGKIWTNPGAGCDKPKFCDKSSGKIIAGIHASVVQLTDGRLMAIGRSNNIDQKMAISISRNMGRTWTYSASEFPPVGSCQRISLMRLMEGQLLLVSFTDLLDSKNPQGITFTNDAGEPQKGFGLFAALSMDDGKTWPVKRLLTDGRRARKMKTLDGKTFVMSPTTAEQAGYLAATQTPDGVIHLLSSYWHYRFNLAWLRANEK